MGLAELFLGQQNPFAQWAGANRNTLGAIGAGVAMGPDFGTGLGNAARMLPEGRRADDAFATTQKAEAERQQQLNMTTEWLRSQAATDGRFLPLLQGVEAGALPVADAFKVGLGYLNGGGGDETFFAPIRGYDASGNPVFVQPGNRGGSTVMDLPEGFQPQSRFEKVDLGTEWLVTDTTTGQQQRLPKENYQEAFDTASGAASGKSSAENISAAGSLASKMPGLRSVVGELGELAKTATYTVTGQVIDSAMKEAGMEPSEAAIARTRYIAMVDNQVLPLLRDTFGAAFTVKEGETLRATLGDPNKSPAEKQVVLEAFIEQKARDLEAMQSRIPSQAGSGVDDILKGYGL